MAHESFENETVAQLINEWFVPIKVDREERPDVDAVYMTATQAMTGQGGWPMTVFATPDGEPFYCGTYFPRANFVRLLRAVSDAWQQQRDAVVQQGRTLAEALGRTAAGERATGPVTAELLDDAAGQLAREYDRTHGGFGGEPKFPPHMNLLFLLRHHERTGAAGSLEIVRHTAEAMARGGIYDQLAGGFARYSVDATWTVPHFEKMLYDNALLLRVYTYLWRLTGDPLAGRIADEVAGFLVREMSTEDGGFVSALDADTEGVEGATYVWTPAQVREALGDADGNWAAELFGVTDQGTFEHGSSVLRLARDVDDADRSVVDRWRRVREALLTARSSRPQPVRDDKVVAAWNGLAITALAEHAAVRPAPSMGAAAGIGMASSAAAAMAAAEALAQRHLVGDRLRRVSRNAVVGQATGVLDDYGCVAEAFCAVHQLTGEGRWLELAGRLLDSAVERFGDGGGGFFDTADDAERLVARPADPTDNATPSGLSAMVAALTTYAALAGSSAHREAAEAALATVAPVMVRHARFTGYACAAAEAQLAGPYEIAVATADPGGDELVRAAWRLAPPGAVVVAGPPDRPGVPLLAGRPLVDGGSTAYVCRGFVCDRPVTTPGELAAKLGR
jgi:uncharacterized protein YyaL (SSP411 family)